LKQSIFFTYERRFEKICLARNKLFFITIFESNLSKKIKGIILKMSIIFGKIPIIFLKINLIFHESHNTLTFK